MRQFLGEHALAWSRWRRQHQAHASTSHYQRRLKHHQLLLEY
ncbi:hypothetical protein [Carbonactinospora thermoautotrophica]|nr:hypothetical protein [Carbonactinospora thermoautotrophica]